MKMTFVLIVLGFLNLFVNCGWIRFVGDTGCETGSIQSAEFKVVVDAAGRFSHILVIAVAEGRYSMSDGEYKLSGSCIQTKEEKGCYLGTSCGSYSEIKKEFSGIRDNNGFLISDPKHFQGERLTLTLTSRWKDSESDESTGGIKYYDKSWSASSSGQCILDDCRTNSPTIIPKLIATMFDPNDCSVPLQIDYSVAHNHQAEVRLWASTEQIGNPPIGGGVDITDEIISSQYIWQSNTTGTVYFKIGVRQQNGICHPSNFVYSEQVTLYNVTCIQEDDIVISSITAGNVDLLTSTEGYKVKQMGDATIVVEAPFSDYPRTIDVRILYDEDDQMLNDFYNRDFQDRVVWESSQDFTGPADTYTFEWDGRDKKYGRILLNGNYTVEARANFSTNSIHIAEELRINQPPASMSFGPTYETSSLDERDIEALRNTSLNWDEISFLNQNSHGDFEWYPNCETGVNFVQHDHYANFSIPGNSNNGEFSDYLIYNSLIEDRVAPAIFTYLGHYPNGNGQGQIILGNNYRLLKSLRKRNV